MINLINSIKRRITIIFKTIRKFDHKTLELILSMSFLAKQAATLFASL